MYKSSDLSYYSVDYKKNGIVALLIGFLAIVLSVYMFYHSIKKIKQLEPGLVIDYYGIKISNVSIDKNIKWKDIDAIFVQKIKRQKLIMISVKNPETYFDKAFSKADLMTMKFNYNYYGAPFGLNNNLDIKFDDLLDLLQSSLIKYQNIN